jgi:hypothetical protein
MFSSCLRDFCAILNLSKRVIPNQPKGDPAKKESLARARLDLHTHVIMQYMERTLPKKLHCESLFCQYITIAH